MIVDHVSAERVLLRGRARGKREVLAELTELLSGAGEPAAEEVEAGLLEREEVMSTGIGHGIAIPHARLESVAEIRLALVRYPEGIDFDALDHKPVFLAFGVIGPPQGTGLHVKLLARIARLVKEGPAVGELLEATSVEGVLDVLRRRDS